MNNLRTKSQIYKKVLIAEDSPDSRKLIVKQLESLGYDVVGAVSDGMEAVKMATELAPSFVIMDINMPKMDGITAARAITSAKPTPIILVTGCSSDEFVSKAIEAGIFAYLVKPTSKKALTPAIELAFARFHEFQELKDEVTDLKEALSARKIIEQAKGILMKRCNIAEGEAFKLLQSHSQKEHKKMKEIAVMIVTATKLI